MNESILDQATKLVKQTNLTNQQIAEGAGVDKNWLLKFKQGLIVDPGVKKIQRVRDFLTAYEALRITRSAENAA